MASTLLFLSSETNYFFQVRSIYVYLEIIELNKNHSSAKLGIILGQITHSDGRKKLSQWKDNISRRQSMLISILFYFKLQFHYLRLNHDEFEVGGQLWFIIMCRLCPS